MITARSYGPAFVLIGTPVYNVVGKYWSVKSYNSYPQNLALLGFCERSPSYVISPYKHHEYNTSYGLEIPSVTFHYGSDVSITLPLTRFNTALVYSMVFNWANFPADRSVPIQSGRDVFALVLYYPARSIFVTKQCDVFPACFLESVSFEGFGPVMEKVTLVVRSIRAPVVSDNPLIVNMLSVSRLL